MSGDNFLSKVLLVFTESLIVAAVGAYFSKFVPSALFIVIFIVELILIFVVNKVRNNPILAPLFLFLFAFLSGLTVGPLVYTFINAGLASIVIQAFVITSLIFVLLTPFCKNQFCTFSILDTGILIYLPYFSIKFIPFHDSIE